jgi:type I restriction enzyme, S subunit
MSPRARQGWSPATLGDVLKIKHGFAFKGENFVDSGDLIVLTPGNFSERGDLHLKGDKEKYYDGSFPDEFLLRKGEILVVMTDLTQKSPILGSAAFIPQDRRFLHNQRLGKVVEIDAGRTCLDFLRVLFNSRNVREQIKGSASGSTVKHTSPSRIYEVRVTLPPLPIQRRIASILSAYDGLIENNTRRIAILEEMARRIFDQWFIQFKFPGHKRALSSGLPPEWRTQKLNTVAAVNRSAIRGANAPAEIDYIDISAVSPGRVDNVRRLTFADAPGRARRHVQHGDTIWSCVRPNRRSYALLLHPSPETIASTGFAVLTPKSVPWSYLHLATTTDAFVAWLEGRVRGAAYPAVSQSDFEAAEIIVPPAPLLERFHSLASPLLDLKHYLERASGRLCSARDLLLPKLISGEIDLSKAEAAREPEAA